MTFQYTVIACVLAVFVSADETENKNILTSSNGIFSANLYSAVSSGNDNLLISPLSLNYALTVVSLGTDGNSLKELRTTLNQPDDENAIVSSYRKFTEYLKGSKQLAVASNVYVDNKFELKEQFKNNIKDFDAGIDNLDFAGKPEESRITINKFVANKTNDLIPELFASGSISKDTASVIVNAVYFKSEWQYPFLSDFTSKKTFHGLDKDYEVDMMYRGDTYFKYREDSELNAQLLELPYLGGYSFLIILPKEKNGITEVEGKLKSMANNANSSPFIDVFKNSTKQEVEVFLPKFKFEQTHNLRQTLEQMGIKDIFSSNANFSKLSDTQLVVTQVIQKTYIDVNEKQTEAAAATGVNIQPLSAHFPVKPPVVFNADHPFIYAIKHKRTETLLFVGRYNKP